MKGKLVSLHRSTDAGTTFGAAIADVIGIEPGERTAETTESTQYGANDPDGDYKTYDYALKSGGEWGITVRYRENQTDIEALVDAFENSTKEHVQVQFPAPISRAIAFRCLITKVGLATPREGQVDRTFTLMIDGKPTDSTLP